MINFYIDESGSMTSEQGANNPYFLIAMILPKNCRSLKTTHKRFVSKYYKDLQNADKNNKMFSQGKFKELKGSEFTPQLKKKFVEYFCKNNQLDIFYIIVDNNKVDSTLYSNTARGFNYLIKLALQHFLRLELIDKQEDICIQCDERNQKTQTKAFLKEYLITELVIGEKLINGNIDVSYFDSCNNYLIQVADVFANLMYSHLYNNNYSDEFKMMLSNNYIKNIFVFPINEKSIVLKKIKKNKVM